MAIYGHIGVFRLLGTYIPGRKAQTWRVATAARWVRRARTRSKGGAVCDRSEAGYMHAEADELMHASAAYQAAGDTYQHGLLVLCHTCNLFKGSLEY